MKWEMWDEVLKLNGGPLLPKTVQEGHEVSRWRAAGIAHFHQGSKAGVEEAIKMIEAARKAAASKPAKEEVRKAEPAKPADKTAAASKAPEKKEEKKPGDTDKALETLRVLLQVLAKQKGAAATITASKDLPKELAVECWLRLGDKLKAADAAQKLPQDLAGSIQKALALHACGKIDEARKAMQSVRERSFAMDAVLPVNSRLDALAADLDLKEGWRGKPPVRKDLGKRPELASLGPIHWTPPAAPPWRGMDAKGEWVTDKDWSGKPVVLVFYIGGSCAHCMEQLNAVEAAMSEFQKRNLPVVALSPEPMALVGKAHKYAKTKGGFPFPLLAADKEVFRSYRAWDDFEDVSLHAMAVVDGQGRLRWLDVSYEPFMDVKFVAQEAERLLGL